MKKAKIILLLQIIFVTIFFSCAPSKKVAEEPEVKIPVEETSTTKPVTWKQSYYPKLAISDPILFYNSSEINISGDFFNQTFELDGKLRIINNVKKVSKTVDAVTPGKLFDLKKDVNGKITEKFVSFSQNDATYKFSFRLYSDGSFRLNGNAKLVFEGKEYPVTASIKGEKCELLFVVEIENNVETINEKAEGEDVSGTKTITLP